MPAVTHDFQIEQGTTLEKTLIWKDNNKNPRDLTGYTARLQMRPSKTSDTVMVELTTENGGITLGGPSGTITLNFTEQNTEPLTRDGVYDLEIVIGNSVKRLIEGTITVSRGVTRND